jgi:hypothetical protein
MVPVAVVLVLGLNAASTANAAGAPGRCFRVGSLDRPEQGYVVARPGVDVVRAVERDSAYADGPVVVPPAGRSCALTFWVARTAPGRRAPLWVDGWSGTVRSSTTRIGGLVAATDVADAVRGSDVLKPGGDADLPRLAQRLDDARAARLGARIALVAIMLGLALVAPRRALMAGPAAIAAALVLSAFGSTTVALFALLALLGAFAPLRALWLFLPVYLAVLALFPETSSLAILGPHPQGAGRFHGVTNEVETLLLGPALVLGLAAAPLVVALVAWSRAGADGGGALVFLSSYATLAWSRVTRNRPLLAVAAVASVVLVALALVALDAATGGSSHVTRTLGDGPGAVWHALTHRWSVSWRGATGTTGRAVLDALLLAGLVLIAVRRPRRAILDALLVGIGVSLLVNDTPQDVLLWGSLQALALRRAL